MFVVKLGRLTNNSTNRLGTSKLNGTLQCRSIAIVDIPCGQRHCIHPLIVTSLDTRPLKSTWTLCTNYTHAQTVNTRRTFPLFNAPGHRLYHTVHDPNVLTTVAYLPLHSACEVN